MNGLPFLLDYLMLCNGEVDRLCERQVANGIQLTEMRRWFPDETSTVREKARQLALLLTKCSSDSLSDWKIGLCVTYPYPKSQNSPPESDIIAVSDISVQITLADGVQLCDHQAVIGQLRNFLDFFRWKTQYRSSCGHEIGSALWA